MDERKKMLLIINPKSGKGQIKNQLLNILDIFIKAGYRTEVHVTQQPSEAREVAAREGQDKDLVVCSGGDGTLNEVVSGLMELKVRPNLGYIPAGSTNDYGASLKIPKQMSAAARLAVEGRPCPVDVGRFCGRRYFVYVAGFGAFTEVSYLTSQDKKNLLGHQAYMLEGLKSLASIKEYPLVVESEGQTIEGNFIFGMVTNSISVGGFKALMDQDVSLNDGLFEVLLIRMPKTPLELSGIVSSLLLKDEKSELTYKFKTRFLRVVSKEPVDWVLDGEFGGSHQEVQIENLCRQIEIRKNTPPILQKKM
ncbi:MAG: YegS/Rv2252/BmrU family lipid kinase [Lachnospiraceae bacterium]|nr:YegS/Rv2252/BmrU family lipid kinase [Lachnospiraceae bacterium]MCI9184622.1 YegS/Rv2252/BmrU family lipid kinase [Lachnospiraceae bacterium]